MTFLLALPRIAPPAAKVLVLSAALGLGLPRAVFAGEATMIPAPAVMETTPPGVDTEKAVFAGGCFWGVQGVFQHVKGVRNVLSGYAGGAAGTARYRLVGGGTTGHAESVEITFDPQAINYATLLQVYFSVAHDPTQLNQQYPDEGTQYRSTVFAATPAQEQVARAYIAQLEHAGVFDKPIATTIETGQAFYRAEGYHQDYLTNHPDSPYIAQFDLPKIAALEKHFPALYRARPQGVAEAGR